MAKKKRSQNSLLGSLKNILGTTSAPTQRAKSSKRKASKRAKAVQGRDQLAPADLEEDDDLEYLPFDTGARA